MRADLDALLASLLPVAEALVREFGEFYPFGATMSPEGVITQVSAVESDEQHPKPDSLLAFLRTAFGNLAETSKIRACCICHAAVFRDSPTADPCDAIVFELESLAEVARIVRPYRKRFMRGYSFSPVIRVAMQRSIFVDGAGGPSTERI